MLINLPHKTCLSPHSVRFTLVILWSLHTQHMSMNKVVHISWHVSKLFQVHSSFEFHAYFGHLKHLMFLLFNLLLMWRWWYFPCLLYDFCWELTEGEKSYFSENCSILHIICFNVLDLAYLSLLLIMVVLLCLFYVTLSWIYHLNPFVVSWQKGGESFDLVWFHYSSSLYV